MSQQLFVRSVAFDERAFAGLDPDTRTSFPFDLPLVRQLQIEFDAPVTFLVGENGTGKSTILESLAVALRCVALGQADLDRDSTLEPARRLASCLRVVRGTRPRSSVFFRAEDAFGYLQRLRTEIAALDALEAEFAEQFEDGSLAQSLAMGSARGQRRALESRYGEDPDAASHGESFLHLLDQRLTAPGLFLLDEPETPFSPVRILALLRLLMERAERGSQLLIATHSPLLLALPGARILCIDGDTLREVPYDEVEHVELTRAFLANPEAFLRRL